MTIKVRAVFVSDVHLGTRACQAERLLEFLRTYDSEYLYLVGDIVDLWAMKRGIHWTPDQNTVVQKILRRARHGQHVMFIPGNHDEALREHDGIAFGEIVVKNEHVHRAADGKRYLLVHGDAYDQVTRYHRWVAVLGDVAYDQLVRVNGWIALTRRLLKRPGYWSLAGYAKHKVKSAVSFIFDFEDSVAHAVRERGLDGVICGHIHSAAHKPVQGITYINCGDWVDSCTGIVEHLDGRMELISAPAVAASSEQATVKSARPAVRPVSSARTPPRTASPSRRRAVKAAPVIKPIRPDGPAVPPAQSTQRPDQRTVTIETGRASRM